MENPNGSVFDSNGMSENSGGQSVSKIVSREQVLASLSAYFKDQTESHFRSCRSCVSRWILQTSAKYDSLFEKYNVVYLMTNHALRAFESDTLYEDIEMGACDVKKPVLLVLQSYGGRIEPAYFIGKMLRKFPDLHVAVPRMAKSAATWLVQSVLPILNIRESLLRQMTSQDSLIIIDITGKIYDGWLRREYWNWMRAHNF